MWKSTTTDRLDKWRSFRQSINGMDLDSALDAVAQLWSTVPFTPYYLDYNQPDQWPDPWTLLAENCYCDLAKALGIVYTVYLSGHRDAEISLCIMKSQKDRAIYNLVVINGGKYVLNLEHGEVVNKKSIPEDLVSVITYNKDSLQLDRF